MAPNLRTFAVYSHGDPAYPFFQILACFECHNLEALEYVGDHLIRPNEIPERHHHSLKKISIQLRDLDTSSISPNMSSVATVLEDLHPGPGEDGPILFPCLSHLAITYPDLWAHFDKLHTMLRQLLENRERAGASIRTIELVIGDRLATDLGHAQRLLIDRLGTLVHTLVITSNPAGFEEDDSDDNDEEESGGYSDF